jgi:S-adenosylmethionine:tRNA ribosyltransferase-isomerase
MRLADLDFELPEELIAQHPVSRRDTCRLLHLQRSTGLLQDRRFDALPALLQPGDVVVRNVSRVIPARLQARRADTGGRCELLLVEPESEPRWWVLARPARALRPGTELLLQDDTKARVVGTAAAGRRLLHFETSEAVLEVARRLGEMPLPPYIRRAADAGDRDAYQTIYARVDGSVAAPTAGLHFTPQVLEGLTARGVALADVVLHVGPGTFRPVRQADPRQHAMEWERFELQRAVLRRCDRARQEGHRVVAVGTTAARVLESLALWEEGNGRDEVSVQQEGEALHGRTRLFLYPPRPFRRVDALLTNFHLPRSTLLLLVDAFAGRPAVRHAYAHAVAQGYRFFSYGDAMLIE